MAAEEAVYTVEKTDGDFQVRMYAPQVVAEVVVDGALEEAGNTAFRPLFNYISGANRAQGKIAMTAPVGQQADAQKIAMTAPVGQAAVSNQWAVTFMMPSNSTLATLPAPTDERVRLRAIPGRRMAAVRYSGAWSRKTYERNLVRLREWMKAKGLVAAGEAVWARYNPPYTPWFLRRNEILLPMGPAGETAPQATGGTNMIQIIKAKDRHFSDYGWLKTYWLFSFSDYYNPANIQFGALRVFNDDVVEPEGGFPTHPHREMEIVTVVLEGEMTHEDSMGNKTVIRAGDVQRMSAGTGLTHSEFNLAKKPVHFYQIWIFPDEAGLKPTYDQKTFSPADWRNRLLPVASGQSVKGAVTFHTDATIYRCDLEKGKEVSLSKTAGRRIFIYLTEGRISVNGEALAARDQARIDIDVPLVVKAAEQSELMLIDVPSCKGWGYSTETLRGKKQ